MRKVDSQEKETRRIKGKALRAAGTGSHRRQGHRPISQLRCRHQTRTMLSKYRDQTNAAAAIQKRSARSKNRSLYLSRKVMRNEQFEPSKYCRRQKVTRNDEQCISASPHSRRQEAMLAHFHSSLWEAAFALFMYGI